MIEYHERRRIMPITVLRTTTGRIILHSIKSGVRALIACYNINRAAILYAEDGQTILAKTYE